MKKCIKDRMEVDNCIFCGSCGEIPAASAGYEFSDPSASDIDKAIERMEKQEAACDELIAMAKRDLADLYKRRDNARKLLEGFRNLPLDRDDFREMVESTARAIVKRPIVLVSCMGTGIRC